MAIDIPTVTTIYNRIISDYETNLSQTIPALQKAVFRVQAWAYAGSIWLLYKLAQVVGLDIFPTTARGSALNTFGTILKLDRQPAISVELTAAILGTNGVVITAGTQFKSPAGVVYTNVSDQTIVAGTATLNIVALEGGEIGNLTAGSTVTSVVPQANVERIATIASTVTDGEDEESDDAYRQRLIDRYRLRPQGGAKVDYIIWSQTVTGVTRVFPFTRTLGIADVYFLRDNDSPRIPTAPEIQDVVDAIDEPDRRPTAATVNVLAPTEKTFSVSVTGFTGDADAKTAATTNLENYFLGRQPFVSGVDITDAKARVQISDVSVIVGLQGGYAGITLENDDFPAVPISLYILLDSEVAAAGVITIV